METDHYTENETLIIVPSGKLDTIHAPQFLKELQTLLGKKPASCLLDLSQVTFLSSSGLQALLGGAKISKKESISFAVFGMQEMVNNVFTMSGFNQFIESFTAKEDALAQVQ